MTAMTNTNATFLMTGTIDGPEAKGKRAGGVSRDLRRRRHRERSGEWKAGTAFDAVPGFRTSRSNGRLVSLYFTRFTSLRFTPLPFTSPHRMTPLHLDGLSIN